MLRKLFNWCVDRDILAASPCVRVKPPGQENNRDYGRCRMTNSSGSGAPPNDGLALWSDTKLLILTAQRRDEVAMVRWNEIDFDGALWTIPAEKSKNGQAHEVPLRRPCWISSTRCHAWVNWRSPRPAPRRFPVSPRQRSAWTSSTEVTDWRLHDLRRTATTGMAKMGIAPHVVDRILNHTAGTIRGVAAVYNRHAYLDERRVALEAWARRVDALVNGTPANLVQMPARTA